MKDLDEKEKWEISKIWIIAGYVYALILATILIVSIICDFDRLKNIVALMLLIGMSVYSAILSIQSLVFIKLDIEPKKI